MSNHRVDNLRRAGWMVAVHNDYKLKGVLHTFWLFTKGSRCVKGEGQTDDTALDEIERKVADLARPRLARSPTRRTGTKPGAPDSGHAHDPTASRRRVK